MTVQTRRTKEDVLADFANVDVCRCGHTRAEHAHVSYPHNDIRYRMGLGHGACSIQGCACGKFTWVRFNDVKKFAALNKELQRIAQAEQHVRYQGSHLGGSSEAEGAAA